MTHGEAGLAVFFSASAFLCLIAAAKALDTAFAFHAWLGATASLGAVFAILDRYFDRPSSLPLQEINGRPNYKKSSIWVKFIDYIQNFLSNLHFPKISCIILKLTQIIKKEIKNE